MSHLTSTIRFDGDINVAPGSGVQCHLCYSYLDYEFNCNKCKGTKAGRIVQKKEEKKDQVK